MNAVAAKIKKLDLKETFVTFPLYIIGKPFKGFDDLRFYGRGKLSFAVVMMFLAVFYDICKTLFEGFVLKGFYYGVESYSVDIPYTLMVNLGPVVLFVVANWSITAITNGIGKMKDIFFVYAYALFPKLILCFIGLIISNVVTKDEAVFATFFYTFGNIAFYFFLFIGLIVIHQYSFTKTLSMVILTIGAMLIIVFVMALFLSLVNDVYEFVYTVIKEISMKF